MPIITLLTDFGYRDPFVGIMKGVILGIAPEAQIVDLTHGIPAQDIAQGALALGQSYEYFPRGTVHVAVVDPGVGSDRRGIVIETGGYLFVGPDNGIFSTILEAHGLSYFAYHITQPQYMLQQPGPTFHGRDVFAPVAAWLARGVPASEMGPRIENPVAIERAKPVVETTGVHGDVVAVDSFGNAITNISGDEVAGLATVRVKGIDAPLVESYSEGLDGALCALVNSSGLLELFVYKGSASAEFEIKVGTKVIVGA